MQDKVSIPFKRESISKGLNWSTDTKVIPSFNSLQTGKYIQSYNIGETRLMKLKVSIPFKRESISKGELKKSTNHILYHRVSIPFKRESISKACNRTPATGTQLRVSIPFKRESISKGVHTRSCRCVVAIVSIPFKRESISKANASGRDHVRVLCFNSLQTGKYIQRKETAVQKSNAYTKFQFPSNGKVYPKEAGNVIVTNPTTNTFQFPSNGKVYPKLFLLRVGEPPGWLFQFPSNGKVYPKEFSH